MSGVVARVAIFLVGVSVADIGRARAEAPATSAAGSVDLSSSFSRQANASKRSSISQLLRVQTHEGSLAYGVALGWLRLSESDQAGGDLSTTIVSNLHAFVRAPVHIRRTSRLTVHVGADLSLGLLRPEPSIHQRLDRNARAVGMATDGMWNAWLWAPSRVAFALPVRTTYLHGLGRWQARVVGEAAVAIGFGGEREGNVSLGPLGQGRLDYQVLLRPWLAAGVGMNGVLLPAADLHRFQVAARGALGGRFGRWFAGSELVANLDEPYGFGAHGEGIWTAVLHLGANL